MTIFGKLINVGVTSEQTAKERKRIKVLNLVAYIALFYGVFFMWFDYYTDTLSKLKFITLSLDILFFSFILFLQYKGFSKFSRIFFTVTIFFFFYYNANYAFVGYYGEYQYLVIPLFSLFSFDNKYIHYALLIISILAFYLPNYYLQIYPEQYFGYLNAGFLFVGVFLIVNFFKRTSEKKERKLEEQLHYNLEIKEVINEKNKELLTLNKFQNHFFVNIAHEMGTPITLLKGQIGQLIKNDEIKVVENELKKLDDQVTKMEGLLTNVIDIAKIEVNALILNKKAQNANSLLRKSYLEFQPLFFQKGVELCIALDTSDAGIAVDDLYFNRVLGNILSNAYKYTPSGGTVELKVTTKDENVLFSVADTGIGVPSEDLDRIFERFYQSENHINKASGSGIGLAFSKEIITLHGGTINASATDTNGLKITLILPIQTPLKTEQDTPKVQDVGTLMSGNLLGKRILVVDDNAEMRLYIASILQHFTIVEAENGKVALDRLAEDNIDAVVTDYMMPIMNGLELVTTLKESGINVPVLILTARADVKSKLDMLELGVDDYLTKPFVEEELLLRVKNTLFNHTERAKFRAENTEQEPTNDTTNDWVLRCKSIVLKHIASPYFGVSQLSEELDISERTLYRILKKETGLGPNMFIRELKLLQVRDLVEQKNSLTLQELATSVGLSNGTYLNQLYLERFGKAIND